MVGGLQALPDIAYAAVLGKQQQTLFEETWGAKIAIPTALPNTPTLGRRRLFEEVAIEAGHPPTSIFWSPSYESTGSGPPTRSFPSPMRRRPAAVIGYIQLGLSQERLQNLQEFVRITRIVVAFVWRSVDFAHVVDSDQKHHQTHSGIVRSGRAHLGRAPDVDVATGT